MRTNEERKNSEGVNENKKKDLMKDIWLWHFTLCCVFTCDHGNAHGEAAA